MNMSSASSIHLSQPPFKNVATALKFGVLLGPIGLLYASFWGGFSLIFIDLLVITNKFWFAFLVIQLISCIWSVGAVEGYNKKLLESMRKT